MFEENLALLRTRHKNVQRYRQLLETSLTDLEREFIAKRLAEEQSAVEGLAQTMLPLMLEDPAAPSSRDPRAA